MAGVSDRIRGVVVGCEGQTDSAPDELFFREVDPIVTRGGRITDHVMCCTRAMDEATVARHKVDAPMIRR